MMRPPTFYKVSPPGRSSFDIEGVENAMLKCVEEPQLAPRWLQTGGAMG